MDVVPIVGVIVVGIAIGFWLWVDQLVKARDQGDQPGDSPPPGGPV